SDKIAPYEIERNRIWKSPRKVVVINGSARGKNGHTYLYLKHFIEGMKSAGAFVEEIDIYDANIKITSCLGCEACWSKNQNKCVLNDDANSIIEKINNAYLTIWAFPLFVDSVPAKVKALLDRFFVTIRPVFVPFKNITRHPLYIKKEKYIALFSVCGFPEISHLSPLKETFKHISQNCHAPIIANILRPSSQFLYKNPGCKFYLEKVFKNLNLAGREIVKKGKINKKVLENIQSDFGIPKETWLNYSNMYWRKSNG
ncbi:MAG TPA: flavodoxin family protein, partial [Spirochaetota bacterium]|nr:flavodoxin family protein [Spirochaetota bacterium]